MYNLEGRHLESIKVLSILEQPIYSNVSETRGFLRLVGYYRIFVQKFSKKAAPLYYLLKANVEFVQTTKQQLSIDILKEAITTAPALVTINYRPKSGKMYIGFNASLVGQGSYLVQEVDGKKHPTRFKSGIQSLTQSKYDAGRREALTSVLYLKKFQAQLYSRYFFLETNALILAKQLRRTVVELPSAQITRQVAFMLLFDFNVIYMSSKTYTTVDALLRRLASGPDDYSARINNNIEEQLDGRLLAILVTDSN